MADEGADTEIQENELLALESIYDETQFIRSVEEPGGQFNITLELPVPFVLKVSNKYLRRNVEPKHEKRNGPGTGVGDQDARQQDNDGDQYEQLDVEYLPPLVLNFSFPVDYPSRSPPNYSLSCKWLNEVQLTLLCQRLDDIWTEIGPGCEVLFQWIQFLTDETLSFLKIASPLELRVVPMHRRKKYFQRASSMKGSRKRNALDGRACQDVASITVLVPLLLEYDKQARKRAFSSKYFDCNVCFAEKPGSMCIAFPNCDHVFCSSCMGEYFRVQIEDGAVRSLTCPAGDCDSQADPSQVKQLVSGDLYERYEKYLLQSSLDCMADVIYCPRPSCQSPVLLESESTMGMCPQCYFAFCTLCKRSYHGVAPCPVTDAELKELRKKYLGGTKEEKDLLEKRYGKKKLQYAMEEMFSEQWIVDHAKRCPRCKSSIQKTDGCNKMTCFKCTANFCWLCGVLISTSNPYDHFNSPSGGCFNKLFEGLQLREEEIEDDEDDWVNILLL